MTEQERKRRKRLEEIALINNLNEQNRRARFGGYPGAITPPIPPEPPSGDTTASGQQVHWVTVADSNYNGTGTSDITIAPGILYVWNWNNTGPGLTEITSQNIAGNGVTSGTPWKAYAAAYAANNPGKKVVMVLTALGGSDLINDWSSTGALRGPSAAAVDACLAFLNLSSVKTILSNACINDVRVPASIANIQTAFNEIISYLNTKFPSSPILYTVPGKDGTINNSLLLRQVRDMIVQKQRTLTNFYIAATATVFEGNALLQVDELHWAKVGSEHVGESNANWHTNNSYGKYARALISCHFANLTSQRKSVIDTYITSLGNNIYGYEYLFHAQESDVRDTFLDYTFLTGPFEVGLAFTADQFLATAGTVSSYFRSAFIATTMAIRSSSNDISGGIYLKTVRSDATTLRTAFGATIPGTQFVLGHTTTGVFYRVNDNTLTLYAEASLQNESEYVIVRDSGTSKAIRKNGSEVGRVTINAVGGLSQNVIAGNNNNNGAPATPMDFDYTWLWLGAPSLINMSTDYTARKARDNNWNL